MDTNKWKSVLVPKDVYEKIKENERCDGPKLTSEKASNFRECKQRCASNDRCRFFAFWSCSTPLFVSN